MIRKQFSNDFQYETKFSMHDAKFNFISAQNFTCDPTNIVIHSLFVAENGLFIGKQLSVQKSNFFWWIGSYIDRKNIVI